MADYDLDIAGGILAGMRVRLQKEELKRSRLELAEYEATAGYRDVMRTLDVERSTAEKTQLDLENGLLQVQNQYAAESAKLGVGQQKANLESTESNTRNNARESISRVRGEKIDQAMKLQGGLANLGQAMGHASKEPTIEDYTLMAKSHLKASGVADTEIPNILAATLPQIQAIASAEREELIANRQTLAFQNAQRNAEMDDYIVSASLTTLDPVGIAETLGAEFGLPKDRVAAIQQRVGSTLTEVKPRSGNKFTESLEQRQGALASEIDVLESKGKLSKSETSKLEKLRAEEDKINTRLQQHFGTPPQASKGRPLAPPTPGQGIPELPDEIVNLTEDELAETAEAYGLTVDQLKLEIRRRKAAGNRFSKGE
jgi:hypothetical protein